ncbi:MAG TPA: hypothetical protein VLG25_00780 [Patescibacteria group bacterium]|nr:hypothetical protein [Patescibacteria group bacterium]
MHNKEVAQIYLSEKELRALERDAKKALRELVTPQGIYASPDEGWRGPYHSWFGRDSSITADLIFTAEKQKKIKSLSKKSYLALQSLTAWQGSQNNSETGEEKGKLPHEIRNMFGRVSKVQHAANSNFMPWFVDPSDGLLKNWDSADSTPLWVIAMARGRFATQRGFNSSTTGNLRLALEWCLNNLNRYGGLAGFLGADLQDGRIYSGLHNQGWKDSFQVYQNSDGSLAKHPIKDVLINAEMWSALKYGADIFKNHDPEFAEELSKNAALLKRRFNSPRDGFLFKDTSSGLPYFAQALDGNNQKLESVCADVGMCFWAYHKNACIIDERAMDRVVARLMQPDLFNPEAGIRNYSTFTSFKQGTGYHGSAYTYWPFVSALIVRGLDHFGYKDEAMAIASAMLRGISRFGSNIELFVETEDHMYKPWHHPKIGQQSSVNQAWTAAGVYYASRYLQDKI